MAATSGSESPGGWGSGRGTVTATEHHLRRALDAQRELVCEWAADGRILFCNRAYREFFDYDTSVIGRSILELIPPDEVDAQRAAFIEMRDGHDRRAVTRHYDDGRIIEWLDTVVRDGDSSVISVLSVGRDATERVRSEEALRRSEQRFRLMLTHIWDSITLISADGDILETTGRYRQDLAHETPFWEGRKVFDLVHTDDQVRAASRFAEVLSTPRHEATDEVRLARGDGGWSWVELDAVNLLEDPDVRAVVLTSRNIDRRKAIEAELDRRRDDAEKALRRRIAFLANVSHELRNALHGMLGLTELLTATELSAEASEMVNALYQQTTTLRRLVEDLLDQQQIELGCVRLVEAPVDIDQLVEQVLQVSRTVIRNPLTLTHERRPGAPAIVMTDADRLRQVLTNLVSNACKYTDLGSVRVVTASATTRPGLRLEVHDTGPGIEAAELATLFEPYERGTSEQRLRKPGVGLGLAIVKGIAEAMGGQVGASSVPGKGSVFWIEIPAVVVGAASGRSGDAAAVDVLVVDDDPVNRLLATKQLERLGARPLVVHDADAALELLQSRRFDVVLVDVDLRGISGPELAWRIRQLDPPCPYLVGMTASNDAADSAACLATGMDELLSKPATLNDIQGVLDNSHRRVVLKVPALPVGLRSPAGQVPGQHAGRHDDVGQRGMPLASVSSLESATAESKVA